MFKHLAVRLMDEATEASIINQSHIGLEEVM